MIKWFTISKGSHEIPVQMPDGSYKIVRPAVKAPTDFWCLDIDHKLRAMVYRRPGTDEFVANHCNGQKFDKNMLPAITTQKVYPASCTILEMQQLVERDFGGITTQ